MSHPWQDRRHVCTGTAQTLALGQKDIPMLSHVVIGWSAPGAMYLFVI